MRVCLSTNLYVNLQTLELFHVGKIVTYEGYTGTEISGKTHMYTIAHTL